MSLDNLNFRASGIAPLFLGTDGLTDAQADELKKLSDRHASWLIETDVKAKAKLKLTANMERDLDALLKKKENFDNGIIELPQGAKTYVESLVNQIVYKYSPSFRDRKTEKGNRMESAAIELANLYFMTDYKKSESAYKVGFTSGHPDIEDEENRLIADIKCSWTKDTFPKLPDHISNSTYEWQLKTYLWQKSFITKDEWRSARLIYVLMSTPEDLVPDIDGDDLHYVDDLDLGLRITYVEYELTNEDIAHMERRLSAAVKYAEEYYSKLIQKCIN